MSSIPPFSLTRPRYDQSKFTERVRHFYEVTDPRSLFTSKSELTTATELLQQFKDKTAPPGTTDAQLWNARRIKESMVHPDTGKIIPEPFRFSAFAPVNILIVPTMLLPSTIASTARTIGIHWLNQSYNAGVNFANRNASSDVSEDTLIKAYCAAVTASISIGISTGAITKKVVALGRPALATAVRSTLPFTAVVAAGCINVGMIRKSELVEGVQVEDHEGTSRGRSVKAGQQGIAKCCVARTIWNFPIMVIPPLIMSKVSPSLPRRALLPMEVFMCSSLLFAGVPLALGAFPQIDEISTSDMESKFQNLTDSKGLPIEKLFFNKGL